MALRTAVRATADASRRDFVETPDLDAVAGTPADQAFSWEIKPLLHEELGRLPENYRAPIVLCHLEGKSHEDAARLLHWPIGTVSGRLSLAVDSS